MIPQDVARRRIINEAIVNQYEGMLLSDIIDRALADVPRLMQAIGAERDSRLTFKKRTHPNVPATEMRESERWLTQWQEMDSE